MIGARRARILGRRYPEPVVDVKRAARRATELVWAKRKGQPFRREAQGILTQHASRKEPRSLGQTQRDTNWAARDDGQLELDL